MFLLGVSLGYKTRSGLPESKDMNNESVLCFCVTSHYKHSDSEQPPFYLLISSVGQQFRLGLSRQFFCCFLLGSFMWLQSSGSSTRLRWPKIASFTCLAVVLAVDQTLSPHGTPQRLPWFLHFSVSWQQEGKSGSFQAS